ncbi:probable Autophagy-related protein 2 [Rhynchosporium graminicola]|uniref:Autophagy-related protein 2 n=1 Tax=Rhynchosporium graminicola TaxID=2792576 RepID=A0A1E1LE87_9HELO|nr:probable Autophagy-related protein 2 [Rhynchosporium commune]
MASYFQSYFQASSMPKRLLQYILTRIEILDTDALDLQNLDIAWGKNSVFEFRDVALRLRKLENLLQLPPSLEVAKAQVLLLRLTIPVDIYSSPIIVEVEGVESLLRVKPKMETGAAHSQSRTNHDRINKRPSTPRPSKSPKSRRESEGIEEDDEEAGLPTAVDLAASFLQTEPEDERAEFEAAILSETQEIGASPILSDDEEISVGTGAALSLPTFMARFIQGIVDRLQVRVRGITINLDVELPPESPKRLAANQVDAVTVQLKVEDVEIQGVTRESGTLNDSHRDQAPFMEGKRLISLSRIRGFLVSDAGFLSTLARSSAMSSPSATHSNTFEDSVEPESSSGFHESTGASKSYSTPDDDSTVSSSPQSMPSVHTGAAISTSVYSSIIASDSGRFEDAPEDDEASSVCDSHASLSEIGDSVYGNSAYLNQVTNSTLFQEDQSMSQPLSSSIHPTSPSSTPRASVHLPLSVPRVDYPVLSDSLSGVHPPSMLQSTTLPTRSHPRFSHARVSHSQPSLHPTDTYPARNEYSTTQDPSIDHVAVNRGEEDDEYDSSTPLPEEDLSQSQLFSHEDAESMYMSAVSHTSTTSNIPGGWIRSSSESEGSRTQPGSPILSQNPEQGSSCDNLEHARHVAPHKPDPELAQAPTMPSTPRRLSLSAAQTAPSVPRNPSDVSERSTTSSNGYTRLTKEFFNLDRIVVYVPMTDSDIGAVSPSVGSSNTAGSSVYSSPTFMSQSTLMNVPGSFSTHLPSPQKPTVSAATTEEVYHEPKDRNSDAIEIAIGKLLVQFDVSMGKLIFKLISQLRGVIETKAQTTSLSTEPTLGDQKFVLAAQNISVMFLERLEDVMDPPGVPLSTSQYTALPSADVLLRVGLSGLDVQTHMLEENTKTSIKLKKFVFGYARENIVSFDAGLLIGGSVRDLKASDGIDLSLNITQAVDTTRCEIVTLPLHVSIDLQRLDETFSWFGGLSSVLNLGSSMASNATVTANSASKPRPRGVHFETPIRPDDNSLAAQNKVDIRVGGFVLDLVGTECSVGVETSAVKVVSRDEGIGVFVQKIRLSGPHLKRAHEEPAINVEITSTRVEYLASPKDADLDRLLSLITPSKAKYDQDDDILLDTLLRQRKQGAVVRLTIEDCQARIGRLHEFSYLPELGEEVSRLSTVAKYLPDDDRPGLLSLITVHTLNANVDIGEPLGTVRLLSTGIEIAQISLPSLIALSVAGISARRNASEELIGAATEPELRDPRARSPAVMARMIGDEMEPVVKIKLWNLKVEYRVTTLMTILGLTENATVQDISASLTASVATLTEFAQIKHARSTMPPPATGKRFHSSKPLAVDIVLRDCILGMNPLSLPSKVLVVLTEAHVEAVLPKDQNASAMMELNKASILVIDNVAHLTPEQGSTDPRRNSFDGGSTQVADLCATGYVSVSYISSAKAIIQMSTSEDGEQSLDVELRDDLFVLESCADSTQTLIAVLGNLSPPILPTKETKYRTKVIPVQDLLASLSGDAFGTAEGDYNFDDDFGLGEGLAEDFSAEDVDDLDFDSHYYQSDTVEGYDEAVLEDEDGSVASTHVTSRDTHDGVLLDSIVEPQQVLENQDLEFQDDHFGTGSVLEGTAHRWNSAKNTYDRSNAHKIRTSPLRVCVRDVHIIWNLFDGYDWQHTRDAISQAVQDVESKAIEKRARNERRPTFDQDIDEEETVIGDFLFNSIYIGIPANRDPRELAAAINQELNDNATETESIATTSVSSSPSRQGGPRKTRTKRLRLQRSKHHKITFELGGVSVDLVSFPPGSGETQNSVDVRVRDFEIFDHVPTSTWRKFATYMQDAGERETGTNMIHIEILNVKPVLELAAAEIVLKATILPLRLHVDQDALDFITRFFEFKDDTTLTEPSPSDSPFLQRVEVNSVRVKLDFKPKRVDYAGLRSGHTTEFMNFLILDEADMVLRHTIIYGISGFEKLGKCLNDIWMPDIQRNQLPGILAGLAPVRSLVNVGGGFRQLVVVPMREYKKDGRIVRGISKGAAAFAKTTGTELVKLGAKVAVGVQTVLQGAETILGPASDSPSYTLEGDDSEEENKQISLYANQPVGVLQGLRGGYAGLQRDLILARDAIIAVPGEAMEGGNAAGVLRAVRKHAPTVILRPAIGVARAGGQILMGATNSLDPVHLQRAEAKYKRH